MALEFRVADFAYPFSLWRLRATFEKTQWFSRERQTIYQEQLLRRMVDHAYSHVPYYRRLFDHLRLKPHDIRCVTDLHKLPVLTKQTLRDQYRNLQADNLSRFRPNTVCTSGTTGKRLEFLVDKPSNVLEFVYYWRHWNSAGYRLGECFAEFSSVFFRKDSADDRRLTHFQRLPNRLLLNSSKISAESVDAYAAAIRQRRPGFLKGLPSALYYFCLFLREKGVDDLSFKAVFSTGEKLLRRYRNLIEDTFRCKVYDSYGHMERTVAVSECPHGGLHVNSDYGVLEVIGERNRGAGKVIGTSLHCYSMPLIRYEVGDLVQIEPEKTCACGRQFPLVRSIDGREADVIVTPNGEVITTAFLIFEEVQEILAGQILQESAEELRVRIVPTPAFTGAHEQRLRSHMQKSTDAAMRITVEVCATFESLRGGTDKFRPVVSRVHRWRE